MVELVAHRSGNLCNTVAPAVEVADTIEIDVHVFRRRLEVRHAKIVWPSRIQWEKWWVDLKPTRPPALAEILERITGDTQAWLDLKGFTPGFTRAVLRRWDETAGADRTVTISSRSWWTLRPGRGRTDVRTMRSVGNRWQLWAVQRIRRWGHDDGIVIHQRLVDAAVADRLLAVTPLVVTWAVDDLDRALELIDLGVRGLIIDDLDLIRTLRERADR